MRPNGKKGCDSNHAHTKLKFIQNLKLPVKYFGHTMNITYTTLGNLLLFEVTRMDLKHRV